jgi:ligand-binding sensor domain-containing protein/serine phosphatase RsbU (regulator of sigma subunit)
MNKGFRRLFFLFALIPVLVSGQQNNFVTYSIEAGLPQSTVFAMHQDSRGYLWLGTDGGGVSRFDGVSFRTFTKKDGLSGNIVRAILEDHTGTLWLGTNEGITLFDGYSFRVINAGNGLSGNKVLRLFEDSQHNIWACTDEGGVNRITLQKGAVTVRAFTSEDGLNSDFIFDIYEDRQHRIWLAAFYGGLNVLTFKEGKASVKSMKGIVPSDLITTIEEDNEGNVWFGSYDQGVFKASITEAGEIEGLKAYNTQNGFTDNTVWDILCDRKGNVWFATNSSGVVRMNRDKVPLFSSYTVQNGLPNNQVLSLMEDTGNNLWLGTNGSGLCMFQGERFVHYTEKEGLPKNQVYSITQDRNRNYLLGTNGSGLVLLKLHEGKPHTTVYTTADGLSDNFIRSISTAPDGSTWIATSGGISRFDGRSFTRYDESHGLVHNSVNSIYVDRRGIVWCGTSTGVSRYDGKRFLNLKKSEGLVNDDVQTIIGDKAGNIWFGTLGGLAKYSSNQLVNYDEAEGLSFKEVYALAEDNRGNIWIGTHGGGLYRFGKSHRGKKPIQLMANEGRLSSNIIYSLAFLDDHTLIVGTNKGFDKVGLNDSMQIVRVSGYERLDGFTGVENNQNAIHRDDRGNMWFGTVRGVTCYSPALDTGNTRRPEIHITNLRLFFENVSWEKQGDTVAPWFRLPKALSLGYSKNHVTFDFAGISLANPSKVTYRYRLEGWEEEWSPALREREVTYSRLSPGSYTFKVVAVDGNGNTSEPSSFSFVITPPWYNTPWFYVLCALFAGGAFFSFIKFRERKLKAEKKVLEEKVAERTREVVKQKEVIEEKNKDITDSINYAKRIQTAILPSSESIARDLPGSFVLFKPKDIVSGDFYFFARAESQEPPVYTLAAVDCTGHGVPGAFMSMIGNSILNQIIREKKILQPSEILNYLHEGVREALKQNESDAQTRDGMDIALCTIDFSKNEIQYAGANRPLYVITQNGLEEIKPDKHPIGGIQSEEKRTFTNHTLRLNPGDSFYLSTDGYADQFGGQEGKKFMTKRFKSMLVEKQSLNMQELRDLLDDTIEQWRGELEQVDDICVIGVKL